MAVNVYFHREHWLTCTEMVVVYNFHTAEVESEACVLEFLETQPADTWYIEQDTEYRTMYGPKLLYTYQMNISALHMLTNNSIHGHTTWYT